MCDFHCLGHFTSGAFFIFYAFRQRAEAERENDRWLEVECMSGCIVCTKLYCEYVVWEC